MVQSAIGKVTNVCQAANIRLGIFGINVETVKPYIGRGYNLITVGMDTLYIMSAVKQTLNELNV